MYYIYFIQQYNDESCVKIGMTKDLSRRIKDLQTGNPSKLTYYKYFKISECEKICKKLEKFLHTKCHKQCIRGEWFFLSLNELENICVNIDKYLQKEIKFLEI